jgi:hypothetical protein
MWRRISFHHGQHGDPAYGAPANDRGRVFTKRPLNDYAARGFAVPRPISAAAKSRTPDTAETGSEAGQQHEMNRGEIADHS